MAEDRNKFLNDSGKAGLILGGVAIAYFLIGILLGKVNLGFFGGLLNFLLWAAKLVLCIWLLHGFLKKFAATCDKDRSRTFRFVLITAFCSALVYSAFCFAYTQFIVPDFYSEAFQMAADIYSGMLTSEQMDTLLDMEPSLPRLAFFGNLIWCWLFGTIVSAISSSRICGPSNPFEE